MGSNDIKKLRVEGKLIEAHSAAAEWIKNAIEAERDDDLIWARRAMSWVLYDLMKKYLGDDDIENALKLIDEIESLQLSDSETMFYDTLAWQLGSLLSKLTKILEKLRNPANNGMGNSGTEIRAVESRIFRILDFIKTVNLSRPSEGASFLVKMLHRALKETRRYAELLEWFGMDSFRPEDYEFGLSPNGKKMMSLAEQIFGAHTKGLLEGEWSEDGEKTFNREKIVEHIGTLNTHLRTHPEFKFTHYYISRLYAVMGDSDKAKEFIIPFIQKNPREFWAWEQLADVETDYEMKVACYCRALDCGASPEYIVKIRPKLIPLLIEAKKWDEARTEIDAYIQTRNDHGWKISGDINAWQQQPWYQSAKNLGTNDLLYKSNRSTSDNIHLAGIPSQLVVITYVNTEKKFANFVNSRKTTGFFKYQNIIDELSPGDVLKVWMKPPQSGEKYTVFRAVKTDDLQEDLVIIFSGEVTRRTESTFAFVHGDKTVFVEPAIIAKTDLKNGDAVSGRAVLNFNKKRNEWGFRAVDIVIDENQKNQGIPF